ncbi:MAG: FG-GAP-like repeat-containing protein [Bacteroidales bacterium]|nr:FG-GAP-like repeat-containing protein [Bacteroidales bacterium]
MKPIISQILIFFLAFTPLILISQQQAEHIILNEPLTGSELEFEASKSVSFLPNFSYKPEYSEDYLNARINPYLIIPPDGDLEGSYPGGETTGVVGSTANQVSVSPSGSALVSVPLPSPPGVGGMTPQLALVYSSQAGNGPFGYGWSLSGLSGISRTGKTIYHDGFTEGIKFEGTDRYALDGQRLMPVDAQGVEYRTELESFSKITAIDVAGDGPKSFIVKTKNFLTYSYGITSTSRIEATGRTSVLNWLLSRLEDENGNYIDYEYIETNGYGYIDKILYGGNLKTGQAHFYEIRFVYQTGRNDAIISFIAGSSIGINKMAKKIEYYYEGQLVHSYELGSITSGFYSRLGNITENNHIDSKKFNPNIFYLENNNHSISTEVVVRNGNTSLSTDDFFMDINGDGLTDIVCIEWERPNFGGVKKGRNWYYRLNQNNGTFGEKLIFSVEVNSLFKHLLVGDFNGDGLDDFVDIKYINESQNRTVANRFFLSNGNGFDVYQLGNLIPINEYLSPGFRRGDFDGDGKDELFVLLKDLRVNCNFPSSEAATIFIFTLKTSSPYYKLILEKKIDIGNSNINKSNVIVSDFTGNGRSDILVTSEYCESPDITNIVIYETNTLNNDLEVVYSNEDFYLTNSHQVFPGDFNGDGLTDLLTYKTNKEGDQYSWDVALFTGRSGSFLPWANLPLGKFDFDNLFDLWSKMVTISDYNGDGKSDIMKLNKLGVNNVDFKIYFSNGVNFNETFSGNVTMEGTSYLGGFINERLFPFMDFNGDGRADLFTDNIGTFHLNLFDKTNEYLKVKKVRNGLGLTTEILYNPLTNPQLYTKGTGAKFPLTDIQVALNVVSSLTAQDGLGNKQNTEYYYEGLKLHKQGKGLLGFMKTKTKNIVNGSKISETNITNQLEDNYYFLWPQNSTTSVVKLVDQELITISETINETPVTNKYDDKRFFYYIPKSLTKESDLDGFVRSKLSTREYLQEDTLYGNITSEGTYVSPQQMTLTTPTAAYEFRTVNSFTYYPPDIQRWLISRLHEHESVVWEKEDGNGIQAKKTYTYKVNSNLIQTNETLPDNQEQFSTITSYIYDGYGNITYQSMQAPHADPPLPAMANGYVFGSQYKYRFPTEETVTADGIVYKTKFEYDAAVGRMKKSTDPNNLSTYYYYDGFGRVDKTVFPDKQQQQSQLFWTQEYDDQHEDAPERALYYSWSQSSGSPSFLVFYDASGRELRQVSIGFQGEKVYIDTHYTPMGSIDRVSLPYHPGDQPVYSSYQYDDLQRVKMVTYPDNTTAKTEYYPNSVKTINRLGQEAWKYFNASGWLVRSEDHAGKSVEYVYFSDGKLKTAQIVGQPATTIELTYNERRQRHSLSDPNYGLTVTQHDAYDRLISQISPKNETTSFTYDGLGRMATRTGSEGVTSWEYDNLPGRLGSLKSVGSENHQTTYTYDNLLRVTQVVDRIVDEEYTTRYTYDMYGRIKNTIYPTNYKLVSYYNEHNYLSHYREGSSNNKVWEALEMNALGQLNRFATGNGLETTHTYYPGNARLHTVQTKAGSLNPIQDMEYGWDEMGNLNYRKKWIDHNNDIYLNESFGYDVLNRLEIIHLNEMVTGLHEYDKNGLGNMVKKKADNILVFDQGEYGSSRPHALTMAHMPEGSLYTDEDQSIEWTPFDQPESIDQGTKRLEFTYGHHRQRIRQLYRDENRETTKTFAGNCEFVSIDGQQYAYTYLSGPSGLFGIQVKNPDGTSGLFYIHTDHLGSLHTITNENGDLLQELSFDAWGNRRDPATWTFFDKNAESALFDRGFTGHEHLDGFQLINMNGRLYDPVVSRMLSPDNYVQSPDFSESFNRYSYCFNNPLIYTDPSGEIPLIAIVGIYAGANLVSDLIRNDFKMNIGEIGISVGLGAVQGALAATGVGAAATEWTVIGSAVASQINLPIYQSDNFNLSVSPSLLAGTNGLRLGASLHGSAIFGNTSVGFGYNLGRNFGASDLSGQMAEAKWSSITSWNIGLSDDKYGLSYGHSYYGGNYAQSIGNFGFQIGRFSASIENDFLTGSGDKYRSAAVSASYQVNDDLALTAGFSIWTGAPNGKSSYTVNGVDRPCYYSDNEGPYALRNGNWFVGANYQGRSYLAGGNSEGVRSKIQNGWHDFMGTKVGSFFFKEASPHFERMNYQSRFFSSYGTYNPFTIYRQ